MKIINCIQRSPEWFLARGGKPTASRIADIITPTGKAKAAASWRRYMLDLVNERLTRQIKRGYKSLAMMRGIELEPMARAWYRETTGNAVQEFGIILDDSGRWGCSPDGVCDCPVPGKPWGLEIKCPEAPAFLEVMTSNELPPAHYIQCQFSLWVTGWDRWDYLCWTDARGMRPVQIRVEPDARLFAGFAEVLPQFCDELDELEARLRGMGVGSLDEWEVEVDEEDITFKNAETGEQT